MTYSLEAMSFSHGHEVVDIFNYFVTESMAAYPEEPVPYEFFGRIMEMTRGYPSLVVKEESGKVVGFGFLRPHHPARSLRRTVEATYFILPGHTRKGVGFMLLKELVKGARGMGIDNILANISSSNEVSLNFHRKFGFEECGRFRRVGRKFDHDFDVVWMQLFIHSQD